MTLHVDGKLRPALGRVDLIGFAGAWQHERTEHVEHALDRLCNRLLQMFHLPILRHLARLA